MSCKHLPAVRLKVFDKALSRRQRVKGKKKKKEPPSGYICCTCGKKDQTVDHFNINHPLGYCYDDFHLWCVPCGVTYSAKKNSGDDQLVELIDMLENEGLTVSAENHKQKLYGGTQDDSSKKELPTATALGGLERQLSSKLPFYFTPPSKDFLTSHLTKIKVKEKKTKRNKNMHGGHGHNHGPMGAIKKGMPISPSMWVNMTPEARMAAIKAGARSPEMVARKRLVGLVQSSAYCQGVACSVFQAVVEKFFGGLSAYKPLGGIVCSYLFTEEQPSLCGFVKECLLGATKLRK